LFKNGRRKKEGIVKKKPSKKQQKPTKANKKALLPTPENLFGYHQAIETTFEVLSGAL
jgi:hypothetical protein